MLNSFYCCFTRELFVIFRNKTQWFQPLIFFIIFISLFGISLEGEPTQLSQVFPAIIWIGFLLTSLFAVEAVFHRQQDEGSLDQLVLTAYPLWWLLLAKTAALWIATILPLAVLTPILGLSFKLSLTQSGWLLVSLLVGSPSLIFIAVLGAILTLNVARSGIFLGLILLPLYIPILILGVSAMKSLLLFQSPDFYLGTLGAISMFSVTCIPFASATALKITLDD